MLGPYFRDELRAKEQTTGLTLLVEGVSWNVDDPERGLDPLPESLTDAQRQAILDVAVAHVYRPLAAQPDRKSFERALMAVFGNDPVVIGQMLDRYPGAITLLRDKNWPMLEIYWNSKKANFTADQWQAFKDAIAAHHIPITLS